MKLFLSPHPDDETLFGAYKIIREKPLVIIVTYTDIDESACAYERVLESYKAMQILGVSVCFLQIKETELTEELLEEKLKPFYTKDRVFAPRVEGGHKHHDLVGRVALKVFPSVITYPTFRIEGPKDSHKKVEATEEERKLKEKALACYQTQIKWPGTAYHFKRGTIEYE